jgi:S-DNA-T family DNA segregation ATPase FtsK/SpoIIIE
VARTTRRSPAPRTTRPAGAPRRRRKGGALPLPKLRLGLSPAVVRSLIGIAMLVLGAILLIAMALPNQGQLTDWIRDAIVPFFGAGRWLLPFVLLIAGWYVEWGPGKDPGAPWGRTLGGIALAYVALLGIFQLIGFSASQGNTGGRIGAFVERVLVSGQGGPGLLPVPAAFAILFAVLAIGLMIAFDQPLRQILRPLTSTGRVVGSAFTDARAGKTTKAEKAARGRAATADADEKPARFSRGVRLGSGADAPGQAAAWGAEASATNGNVLDEPALPTAAGPISRTVVTDDDRRRMDLPAANGDIPLRTERAAIATLDRGDGELTAFEQLQAMDWTLPGPELLEARAPTRPGGGIDHATNISRIEEKLRSFAIPAKVVATNSGPVVTQYEVKPEHHVKLSRIEALADDLAMALAARSIRIEAPIPGKSVVGIEIPNQAGEVVGFKPLLDETQMLHAQSQLTFALGRDVSGKGYAVDLAKMPHLLVAGATGSGKSVCVNAIITSILMRARPDEVRMILVDLKRVELAPYNHLPHLLQKVIVEPNEAKAVLNWAVAEMEERYKRLASKTVRNITAYNELPGLAPDEKLPFVVIIVDELADLIMREGRKVEDPVVKIAQKARAVGIHLVLATQRPSVNVVTGLIKANVPSRIAFAMASMVDSRTVLDAPGAEDLIGRGDMLYQPVDLPRPVRLQGVFVSDREVSAVTKHWLDQSKGRTYYDEDILAYAGADEENGSNGQFGWLAARQVDEMTPRAAELVTTLNRASTSMLQTKLKLGFARASRVMDELERYGVVGPQDPRNPAVPRAVYGPDNWLRTDADAEMDT